MPGSDMNIAMQFSLRQNLSREFRRISGEFRRLVGESKDARRHFRGMGKDLVYATASMFAFARAYKSTMAGIKAGAGLQEAKIGLGMELGKMPAKERARIVGQMSAQAAQIQATAPMSQEEVILLQKALKKGGLSPGQIMAKGGPAEAAAMLSTITGMVPEAASQAMIKIATPFQMDAERFTDMADQLQRYASASPLDVEEVVEAAKYAVGGLTALKAQFEDLPKLAAVVAMRGKTGSEIGTSLRAFYTHLMAPSGEAKKAMKRYGLEFFDEKGVVKSAEDLAKELREKLGGLTPKQKGAALKYLFETEGMDVGLALMNEGKGSLEEINAEAATQLSLLEKVIERMRGYNAQLTSARGNWETIRSNMYAPLTGRATELMRKWNEGLLPGLIKKSSEENAWLPKAVSYGTVGAGGLAALASTFFLSSAVYKGAKGLKSIGGWKSLMGGGTLAGGIAKGKALEKTTGTIPVYVTNFTEMRGAMTGAMLPTTGGGKASWLRKALPVAGIAGVGWLGIDRMFAQIEKETGGNPFELMKAEIAASMGSEWGKQRREEIIQNAINLTVNVDRDGGVTVEGEGARNAALAVRRQAGFGAGRMY